MVDERLRRLKDHLLSPLIRLLEGRGITPLRLTFTGFLFGLAAFLAASLRWWPAALVLWLINRLLDGLDGALARKSGTGSDLGGYLDILADFLVYALLPIGIALGVSSSEHTFPALVLPGLLWPATGLLLGACYVNSASWMYLAALMEKRAAAEARVTSTRMPPGIIEGSETIFFYGLCLVLPGFAAPLFLLFAALVFLTASLRAFHWARGEWRKSR